MEKGWQKVTRGVILSEVERSRKEFIMELTKVKLGDICEIYAGGDAPKNTTTYRTEENSIPVFSNGIENDGLYGFTSTPKIVKPSVTISARGTIGYCCLRNEPFVPIVRLLVVIPNNCEMVDYLYRQLKDLNVEGSGSVQNQLTAPHIENQEIIIPEEKLFKPYNECAKPILTLIKHKERECQMLNQMQNFILSKMVC